MLSKLTIPLHVYPGKSALLDSEFAAVDATLAVMFVNTNQWKQEEEMAIKAFEFKDSVGENEKLRISYIYYKYVTGEMDNAISTLKL
jgi:hypothetical protein